IWYNGQFYALFFLQNVLKVDAWSVNVMIAIALAVGSIFFVVFGWLSDKIGRKPIIMAGLALGIVCTFPLFKALTWAANPALATAQQNTRATVTAAPGDCRFQFNPVGTAKFTTSCDIATSFLTKNSVPYDVVSTAAPGTAATVKIGNETVQSYDAVAAGDQAKAKEAAFQKAVNMSLQDGGYPLKRAAAKVPDQKLDAFVAANPELKLDAAAIRGGEKTTVPTDKAVADKLLTKEEAAGAPEVTVYNIPGGGAFAMVADPEAVNWPVTIGILFILVVFVTMVYGPIAAILVEMF
ncbi:MAG: MHS family MFS transporter, partial [Mesorhizobium sp.]